MAETHVEGYRLLTPIDIPNLGDEQRRAARLEVCRRATDLDDARQLLDALGLLEARS